MRCTFILALLMVFLSACSSSSVESDTFGFGRDVSAAEIAQWDIDIRPDGSGLPPGSGSATAGAAVYQLKCFACHGENGQGGVNDRLVLAWDPTVNFSTGTTTKTIGNFWPYATTLYDYIYRAMPHNQPGSLSADEVYGLVAYLLSLNGIITEDMVMDASSLPSVAMPARELFYFSEEVP